MERLIWLKRESGAPMSESYGSARLLRPLPSIRSLTRDVLADYDSRGGLRRFWLNEIIAHGGLGRLKEEDLYDHVRNWKVPLKYLKDPSIVSGDPFAPNAILVITPRSFEVSLELASLVCVSVHPERIIVLLPKKGLLWAVMRIDSKKNEGITIIRDVVPRVRPVRLDDCIRVGRKFDCGFISHFAEPGVDADKWRTERVYRNPAPTYDPFLKGF
jgi:hypothetical protein